MLKIINLGCGTKTSSDIINIDWSIYLYIKNKKILYLISRYFLSNERRKNIDSLPSNIFEHDLSKGIPFPNDSIDVVYHSHFLEHLDKEIAKAFLIEVKRVLKPNGIQRIVVPDFEQLCRKYVSKIDSYDKADCNKSSTDKYIENIIGQCVMKEAYSTSIQKPFFRFIENNILGDARKRGITHQWMYDRINLPNLLENLGYKEINLEKYNTSSIPDWNSYGLDLGENGDEYKPGSIYVEAKK